MSSATFNEVWREAVDELHDQLHLELPEDRSIARMVTSKKLAPHESVLTTLELQTSTKSLGIGKRGFKPDVFQHQALLYIRYTLIFKKLEEVYDQMVHPQKLLEVRKMLDAVMGRMLELKQWLVEFRSTDYPVLDDVLLDLKLSPKDLDLVVPRYFTSERSDVLRDRSRLLGKLIEQWDLQNEKPKVATGASMSMEQAVLLIQTAERGRAGRQRAVQLAQVRGQEPRDSGTAEPLLDVEAASNLITRVARGHLFRRTARKMREDELRLIGMLPPEDPVANRAHRARRKETEKSRREKQVEFKRDYEEALKTIKRKIYEQDGPGIKERLQDEIRQWFLSHYRQTGKFPAYPSHIEGGSARIFLEPPPVDQIVETKQEREKREKAEIEAKKKADKEDDPDGLKIEVPASYFIRMIKESFDEYQNTWQAKDEDNFEQTYDPAMIRERILPQVEMEIRVQVDEIMRIELDNLKLALESEKKKKKKKKKKNPSTMTSRPNTASAASQKPKEGAKPTKPKKQKKKADMTAGVPTEQLFAELAHNNILQRCPERHLSDFLGEYNLLAATLKEDASQRQAPDPEPSLADIRKVVAEYCCLPLGCERIRECDQGVWHKAVLLAGVKGSGKSLLMEAIVTETGSNLFNLTPSNTYGKFPGKMVSLMLHMVFKVAKLMAPSVILIDDVEKVFAKKGKTSKEEKGVDGPKRIKKDLLKQLKSLKAEHRVLVLGLTSRPYDAEVKALNNVFTKQLVLPVPDYGARLLLWEEFILRHGGEITPSLDLACLAQITKSYSTGVISTACEHVLTRHRVSRMPVSPLTTDEFIAPLSINDRMYVEEFNAMTTWISKTPLAKGRRKRLEEELAEEEDRKKNKRR